MKARQSLRQQNRVVPRVEALEERQVLSCTVGVNNGVMTIQGDDGVNTVTINQKVLGTVSVQADNLTTSASGIKEIRINTRGGKDTVNYNLNPVLPRLPWVRTDQKGTQKVNVYLGTGDDKFQTSMCPQHLMSGASLSFDVNGSVGDDDLLMDMAPHDIAVDKGASLSVKLDGNYGRDRVTAKYKGELDGNLSIVTLGGPGKGWFIGLDGYDTVVADLLLTTGSNHHSDGLATVRAEGGYSNDNLTLTTRKESSLDAAAVSATADGGPGDVDVLTRTINVSQTSCELDFVII
jgi:hypothetical protein